MYIQGLAEGEGTRVAGNLVKIVEKGEMLLPFDSRVDIFSEDKTHKFIELYCSVLTKWALLKLVGRRIRSVLGETRSCFQ
jgi:hypothetical protein